RPESRTVIHFGQMRHLMCRDIVEYQRRCEDEAPRERQHSGRGARAPATHLVADGDAAWPQVQVGGVPGNSSVEVLSCLCDEPVEKPAWRVGRIAGNNELRPSISPRLDRNDGAAA